MEWAGGIRSSIETSVHLQRSDDFDDWIFSRLNKETTLIIWVYELSLWSVVHSQEPSSWTEFMNRVHEPSSWTIEYMNWVHEPNSWTEFMNYRIHDLTCFVLTARKLVKAAMLCKSIFVLRAEDDGATSRIWSSIETSILNGDKKRTLLIIDDLMSEADSKVT